MAKKVNYAALYPNTHVQGFEEIVNKLQAQIDLIVGASLKGLIQCAAFIRQDTEKTTYITPLDLGNLRSSWFVTTMKGKVANDKWNKGFRSSKRGSRSKVNAAKMKADHEEAITESIMKNKSEAMRKYFSLTMGYSASYAVYIHENISAEFKRKGSGPKWFQSSVQRNSGKMLQIIKNNILIS